MLESKNSLVRAEGEYCILDMFKISHKYLTVLIVWK